MTGSTLSPRCGTGEAFVTLLPAYGDAFLRMQVVADQPARTHLRLHVSDLTAEADRMVGRGATILHRGDGLVDLHSPAGLSFSLVPWRGESVWPETEGRRHRMCLDVPSALFDVEGRFWSEALTRERPTPLNVLMQPVGDGPPGMHPHLVCADRDTEARRHTAAGASIVRVTADRTTLRDPVGREYCLTL
ncbi:hypothetical protein Aau02nite_48630 [Amorphoplanes auranticolor]|uniref:Glyoxalase-like domain-containing protein n=1 Tax=Actinoplanes auranticolor TaxID=47988 RepID=A0A919SFY8_9ACTN|nr:hypothetical protein Aau02nite_48630 [Actinoplanes auranticolor]